MSDYDARFAAAHVELDDLVRERVKANPDCLNCQVGFTRKPCDNCYEAGRRKIILCGADSLSDSERSAYLDFWVLPSRQSVLEPVKYAAGIALRYEATVSAAEARADAESVRADAAEKVASVEARAADRARAERDAERERAERYAVLLRKALRLGLGAIEYREIEDALAADDQHRAAQGEGT